MVYIEKLMYTLNKTNIHHGDFQNFIPISKVGVLFFKEVKVALGISPQFFFI